MDFSSQGEDQEGESDFLQSGEAVEQDEYQSPIVESDSPEVEEDNSQFFEADNAEEPSPEYQMSDDQAVEESAEDNYVEQPAEDYQEESQHEADENQDGFESPMDSFFEDGTDGTDSQNDPENPDPNDPLGISGFANSEEAYADEAVGQKIQPYWIEEEANKLPNTHFKTAAAFSSYAIQDGNLITGQQQNSGAAAATLVVQQLSQ